MSDNTANATANDFLALVAQGKYEDAVRLPGVLRGFQYIHQLGYRGPALGIEIFWQPGAGTVADRVHGQCLAGALCWMVRADETATGPLRPRLVGAGEVLGGVKPAEPRHTGRLVLGEDAWHAARRKAGQIRA